MATSSLPLQIVACRVIGTPDGCETVFGEFGKSQNVFVDAFANFLHWAGHDGMEFNVVRINVEI